MEPPAKRQRLEVPLEEQVATLKAQVATLQKENAQFKKVFEKLRPKYEGKKVKLPLVTPDWSAPPLRVSNIKDPVAAVPSCLYSAEGLETAR